LLTGKGSDQDVAKNEALEDLPVNL